MGFPDKAKEYAVREGIHPKYHEVEAHLDDDKFKDISIKRL